MDQYPEAPSPTISRRTLLAGAGTALAATAAASVLPTAPAASTALAATPDELQMVALRQPIELTTQRSGTSPALPPIGVIAFNRMAYGPRTAQDVERMQTMDTAGFRAFVEEQLNPSQIADAELEQRIQAENFRTLAKTLEQLWADHSVNGNTPPADFTGDSWSWRNLPAAEIERLTFLRAVYSTRQLQEVLFDFWFNHFNVLANRNGSYAAMTLVSYDRDALRQHLFGNFRAMLEATATSPAMLEYLDNYINSAAGPNENYAREIFELHTLGAENYFGSGRQEGVPGYAEGAPIGYVDGDVYEATRAFTGWTVANGRDGRPNTGQFVIHEPWHDRFRKQVLGAILQPNQLPLQDGRMVMDLLAAHPGTARYIARKLCRRLISDSPPEGLVARVAGVFLAHKDAPDQLRRVYRAILLSPEFAQTWGAKIKRPFEVAVSAIRALRADFSPNNNFLFPYNQAGQQLFAWAPPTGYPDTRDYWSSTMPMLHRWRIVNLLIEEGIRPLRQNERSKFITVDIAAQTTARTPTAIVDEWIGRVLGRPMNAEERAILIEFLAQGRNPDLELPANLSRDLIPRMVALLLMSPDFNWR